MRGIMQPEEYKFLGHSAIVLIVLAMIAICVVLVFFMWIGWWVTNRHGSVSPYTGNPMRRGVDLVFSEVEKIHDYMTKLDDPDNPPFDLNRAAICPDTGRIFPNCVTVFSVIKVGWHFFAKYCPGHWISWGSLTSEQQELIRLYHPFLEGFQTEHSCSSPSLAGIDQYHATIKPGPLYVDVTTKTLLGWKCIPNTRWEVLIVKRPQSDPHTVYDSVAKSTKRI